MNLPYRIELLPDPDEGGYVVRCPELPGCISCGETKEDALLNIEDAKREWLAAALEGAERIPFPQAEGVSTKTGLENSAG